jgi:hypothetical protein
MTSVNKWRTVDLKVDAKDLATIAIVDKYAKIGETDPTYHRMWMSLKQFQSLLNLLFLMSETVIHPQADDSKHKKVCLNSQVVSEAGTQIRCDLLTSKGHRGRERIIVVTKTKGESKEDISIPWIHLTRFVIHLRQILGQWESEIQTQKSKF